MVPDLTPDKIVAVDIATGKAAAQEEYKPTSEVALHTMIYQRRPDVGAIVHSHSMYACALACSRVDLPPSHYAVCELLQTFDFSNPAGGSTAQSPWAAAENATVRCAPYHTYGTRPLATATADALGSNRAVLMAAHGAIVTGSNMDEALYHCERLERECEIYWRTLQVNQAVQAAKSNSTVTAPPPALTAKEIFLLQTADGSYGQDHPDVSADDAIQAATVTTES